MSAVLVIAEHDGATLSATTGNTVSAAGQLNSERVDVVILAPDPASLARQAAALDGVDRVLTIADVRNAPYLAALWAPQIAGLSGDYSHVLAPANTFGKDLLPRVAGLLGVGMLSDITVIDGPYAFRRPVYAGNAIIRVAADPDRLVCATVRSTSFEPAKASGSADIEAITVDVEFPEHTRHVERSTGPQSGPELHTAMRVVAGGRGLGGEAGFDLARQLATALGAALGASRAAVDSGWVSNDLQVGQTGKIIAPELYVALGISGAIQHLTGIRDAGTIVAINKDAAAPICSIADIVLVADVFAAVPAMIDALRARQSG
jgi:electron transfer flavoprotein alpha subunit